MDVEIRRISIDPGQTTFHAVVGRFDDYTIKVFESITGGDNLGYHVIDHKPERRISFGSISREMIRQELAKVWVGDLIEHHIKLAKKKGRKP